MLNMKTVTFLLISTTLVGACGGSGGEISSKQKNPFANDQIPVAKETVALFESDVYGQFTIDPESQTFHLEYEDKYEVTGTYDPETGRILTHECVLKSSNDCLFEDPFWDHNILDVIGGYEGTDLVVGNENLGKIGYNPTDAQNLPQGKNVIYKGEIDGFALLYGYFPEDTDGDGEEEDVRGHLDTLIYSGSATTIVDFDNDKLSAEFKLVDRYETNSEFNGLDGTVVKLEDVQIEGSQFSGGNTKLYAPGGEKSTSDTLVQGQFFGDQGEELGAMLNFDTAEIWGGSSANNDSLDTEYRATWSGKR